MALTKPEVQRILVKYLKMFGTSGLEVDKDTVIKKALSARTVAGTNARSIYKDASRFTIKENGGTSKDWPDDWLDRTPATLAPDLV